jgi:hypothetical protein
MPSSPLLLTLKPSKRLKYALLFLYALAGLASVLNNLAIISQFFLLGLLGLSAYKTCQDLAIKTVTIKHSEPVGWQVLENNEFVAVEILKSSVITGLVVLLHCKKRDCHCHVFHKLLANWRCCDNTIVIVNDALNASDYRRLIVRLKITHLL